MITQKYNHEIVEIEACFSSVLRQKFPWDGSVLRIQQSNSRTDLESVEIHHDPFGKIDDFLRESLCVLLALKFCPDPFIYRLLMVVVNHQPKLTAKNCLQLILYLTEFVLHALN